MQNVVRRLGTSSSAQPVTKQTHSGAGSLPVTQELKQNFLGISRKLRKRFRPPRSIYGAPDLRTSIRTAIKLNLTCESLQVGFWHSLIGYDIGRVEHTSDLCPSFRMPGPLMAKIASDIFSVYLCLHGGQQYRGFLL